MEHDIPIPAVCEHCKAELPKMMGVYEHIQHRQKCGAQDYTFKPNHKDWQEGIMDLLNRREA